MNNKYDIMHYINEIRHAIADVYNDDILCQQYAWWILQALCKKKPLQYILGSVPFAGCDILVEPPILIPRPETEEWCLYVIEHLQTLDYKKIAILDIETGS